VTICEAPKAAASGGVVTHGVCAMLHSYCSWPGLLYQLLLYIRDIATIAHPPANCSLPDPRNCLGVSHLRGGFSLWPMGNICPNRWVVGSWGFRGLSGNFRLSFGKPSIPLTAAQLMNGQDTKSVQLWPRANFNGKGKVLTRFAVGFNWR